MTEMKQNKLISVIMPSYNTPIEYLSAAVESVLSQTYEDFEFIIVDDCSTDESVEYLASIDDPRVRVIRNEVNRGITASLNVALDAARGDYIARMDSDDICLPERFSEQVAFMEENPDVIVCGSWIRTCGNAEYERRMIIPDREYQRSCFVFGNIYGITHPTAMFRASMLREKGIRYDETLPTAQDYGMWVECVKHGRMANVEKILLRYRIHGAQVSIAKRKLQMECDARIQKRILSELLYCIDDEIVEKHIRLCRDPYISRETVMWLRGLVHANGSGRCYDKKIFKRAVRDFILEKTINSAKIVRGVGGVCKLLSATPVSMHGAVYRTLFKRIRRKK